MGTYRQRLIEVAGELTALYIERAEKMEILRHDEASLKKRETDLLRGVDFKALGSNEQQRAVAIAALLNDDSDYAGRLQYIGRVKNLLGVVDARIAGLEMEATALRSAIRECQVQSLSPWIFQEAADQETDCDQMGGDVFDVGDAVPDVSVSLDGTKIEEDFDIPDFGERVAAAVAPATPAQKDGQWQLEASRREAELNAIHEIIGGAAGQSTKEAVLDFYQKSRETVLQLNARNFEAGSMGALLAQGNGESLEKALVRIVGGLANGSIDYINGKSDGENLSKLCEASLSRIRLFYGSER